MTRKQIDKQREELLDSKTKFLLRKVKVLQFAIYSFLLGELSKLDVDESGAIKLTVSNINKANKIGVKLETQLKKRSTGLIGWMLNGLKRVLNINKRVSKVIAPAKAKPTIDDRVAKRVLLSVGFDTKKNQLISGGFLDRLAGNTNIGTQVARNVENAVRGRLTLNQFRQQVRNDFTNPNRLGLVERHFLTESRDLFFSIDRAAAKSYGDELGLNYVIWSHTIIKTTRPICRLLANKVLHIKELEYLQNSVNWKGKKEGSIEVHQGGYNCRGSLSYISNELGEKLYLQQRGVAFDKNNISKKTIFGSNPDI